MESKIRESEIEKTLREAVRAAGGRAYKFVSPGNRGVPDRIVCFPGKKLAFVELKSAGNKPTKLQLLQHARLRSMGFEVYVVDDRDKVPYIVFTIQNGEPVV